MDLLAVICTAPVIVERDICPARGLRGAIITQGSAMVQRHVVCTVTAPRILTLQVLRTGALTSHVIIPECNADTRTVELANIETWAQGNNLTTQNQRNNVHRRQTEVSREHTAPNFRNITGHVSELYSGPRTDPWGTSAVLPVHEVIADEHVYA